MLTECMPNTSFSFGKGIRNELSLDAKTSETVMTPQHDKTNKMTCAPCEDSEQHEHQPRLFTESLLCPLMKKPWVLSYLLSAQRRLINLGGRLG